MEDPLKTFKYLSLFAVSLTLVNCAPSAKQLKEAIEKDPSIVFVAIEKDPEKFIEIVNKAAQDAQKKMAEKQQNEEGKERDNQFKNPLQPVVEENRVIFGKKDSPITIVEYSDFECPYCSKGHQTVKQVRAEYGDKVRIVFKHLPLDFHPMALPAAKYFVAAGMQSPEMAEKFHDMVFENQSELRSKKETFLKDAAKKVGLDMAKLTKDMASESVMKQIEADMQEAQKFGMSGTPGFIINGVALKGAYPASEFKQIIDRHLSEKK